ncbi:hypothetical protein [Salinibacterium sp. PAMC 21357]|uniref:hypothetical protein n=1 Tax=Salinibacterium sp. PAMC 21357 TaxID=1112215 RepID=UPI000288756A|nr:hypothetical protein [Salinibacterium sp. PAMC 21357]
MSEPTSSAADAADSASHESASGESAPTEIPDAPELAVSEGPVTAPAVRRRLPGWAWALIVGIPLLLLMAVGALLVTIGLAVTTSQSTGCDGATPCGERGRSAPAPAAEKSPSEATSPVDEFTTTSRVTLDGHAAFDGQPAWSIELGPSWRVHSFDQQGINVFRDEKTRCQLVTSQNLALADHGSTGDFWPSDDLLLDQIVDFTVDDAESTILDVSSTDIPIGAVGSGSTLEFAAATITRTSPAGVHETVEIVARSMPNSESALVAALTCDTGVYDTFTSRYSVFSDSLAITANR